MRCIAQECIEPTQVDKGVGTGLVCSDPLDQGAFVVAVPVHIGGDRGSLRFLLGDNRRRSVAPTTGGPWSLSASFSSHDGRPCGDQRCR